MTIEWKAIPDLDGYYEASTTGLIRRSKPGTRTRVGYVHRTSIDRDGYNIANMSINGKRVRRKVHALVAKTFIPNPLNLPEVNHKNGIKSDNSVGNLEWSTKLDNILHACSNGLRVTGERHQFAKLNQNQVDDIRRRYVRYNLCRGNGRELAKEFNVHPATINKIISGRTWNASHDAGSNKSTDTGNSRPINEVDG